MSNLPISHMTLFKHGVGFFERRGTVDGREVTLTFRVEDMNDILKSLTVIDEGDGQVLGVDYATPKSRDEQLAGSSIVLRDDRSLRDLLVSLRGRKVRLLLDQGEAAEGTLIGLDEPFHEQPIAAGLVSLLLTGTAESHTYPLGRVHGVALLDEAAAADLRFFLRVAQQQENARQITLRLSEGEHKLAVSYIAPAPTWRVSYRLVADERGEDASSSALLLGWGIFDNQLEEDLDSISLTLVAGMPISFTYDLYTPFTPERPHVKEEGRVAAAPVVLEEAVQAAAYMSMPMPVAAAPPPPVARMAKMSRETVADSVAPAATGEAKGELFQYTIATPVSVGRGQSAMVPIVVTELTYTKDLIYNGRQFAHHPVATLRLENTTGLTLEKGPITVVIDGEYVGEALLPLTAVGGELVVPYAVELSARVSERTSHSRELYQVRISGSTLVIEEWDVRQNIYQINNSGAQPLTVLIEHPRFNGFDLFETAAPREMTASHYRFAVEVAARGETTFGVKSRRLLSRHQSLVDMQYGDLAAFLERGLADAESQARLRELLAMMEPIRRNEERINQIGQVRNQIAQQQQQIQQNMAVLGQAGKEGQLRTQYVDRLLAFEGRLEELGREEERLQNEINAMTEKLVARIRGWEGN